MIGAPDVDQMAEAPLEFVFVVGDIGGEIRGLSVAADEHAVLVVAAAGGAQPYGVSSRKASPLASSLSMTACSLPPT